MPFWHSHSNTSFFSPLSTWYPNRHIQCSARKAQIGGSRSRTLSLQQTIFFYVLFHKCLVGFCSNVLHNPLAKQLGITFVLTSLVSGDWQCTLKGQRSSKVPWRGPLRPKLKYPSLRDIKKKKGKQNPHTPLKVTVSVCLSLNHSQSWPIRRFRNLKKKIIQTWERSEVMNTRFPKYEPTMVKSSTANLYTNGAWVAECVLEILEELSYKKYN